MPTIHKPLTIFTLLLTQSVYARDAIERSIVQPASGSAGIACPAADFPTFIQKFSEEEHIQKEFTQYPLERLQLDPESQPEPGPIVRHLHRDQLRFPIIPPKQERVNRMLKIQIDSASAGKASITLTKPDTDYQVRYHFKKNGCWILERIEDRSI
ncbi:hypothetical protein ACI2VH_20645 [Ralstonia nicotianae]|uniref:DUF3828 domain-containing protein n=1 Tax=Ralstonia nicotianae TaxID=3037696 RepID=A0ABX7ZXZ8_9RALS|nr:hypothetical protein [Ralstonia nicotianae]QUP59853.1 hypothetical protein GO999_15550 [Ralstonia nicotianae]